MRAYLRAGLLAIGSCLALLPGGCAAGGARDAGGGLDAATCSGTVLNKQVAFAAADELIVRATYSSPCGEDPVPVVVLAHQLCRDRFEWSAPTHDWVLALRQRGIGTLSIDLRGHGESTRWPDGSTHDLCLESSSSGVADLYTGMVDDVRAALAYAGKELGATATAVVGASIGANSALVAFADRAEPRLAVALSPGIDYRRILSEPAVARTGSRAVLLEAAEDDKSAADAVRALQASNPAVSTQLWPKGGHGNAMIDAHPEELERIANLLRASLR